MATEQLKRKERKSVGIDVGSHDSSHYKTLGLGFFQLKRTSAVSLISRNIPEIIKGVRDGTHLHHLSS